MVVFAVLVVVDKQEAVDKEEVAVVDKEAVAVEDMDCLVEDKSLTVPDSLAKEVAGMPEVHIQEGGNLVVGSLEFLDMADNKGLVVDSQSDCMSLVGHKDLGCILPAVDMPDRRCFQDILVVERNHRRTRRFVDAGWTFY